MSTECSTDLFDDIKKICKANCKCEGLQFASDASELTVEPIGDGNLNDVIRIKSMKYNGTNSAIVKRGPPYIKCLGPEYPLTVDRNQVEYAALLKFHSIVPGCVPKPLCWIRESNMYFMEDLENYNVLRRLLISGVDCEKAIVKLAQDIANVHRETHVSKLPDKEFTDLVTKFKNEEMVALTKNYVFTAPFIDGEPTNKCAENVKPKLTQIYDEPKVIQAAEKMRTMFLEKKECLQHGDLHTGSVMCTAEGDVPKMIDLEFAFMGPCAFDVGMFLANLIFTYYQHMSIEQNNDVHRQYSYRIIDLCKRFVEVYLEHMTCLRGDHESFMSDVTGFCGCEIIRRIVGVAHVEDFNESKYGEMDALGAGIRLLHAVDRIHTIDRLMVIALMLV